MLAVSRTHLRDRPSPVSWSRDAITAQIGTLPEQLRRSLSWDQGGEMAQHVQLKIGVGIEV